MARSPIEVMIDKVCGYSPNKNAQLPMRIRCPICQTEKGTWRDKTDPPGATTVVFPCRMCVRDEKDLNTEPLYFDASGRQIVP